MFQRSCVGIHTGFETGVFFFCCGFDSEDFGFCGWFGALLSFVDPSGAWWARPRYSLLAKSVSGNVFWWTLHLSLFQRSRVGIHTGFETGVFVVCCGFDSEDSGFCGWFGALLSVVDPSGSWCSRPRDSFPDERVSRKSFWWALAGTVL
ncbi:hypothetical protein [Vibrio aerogenes]|uniref:hypothetical protein n=1 Tax=Vibrio aerogenes TaxID=92172 RepID=UPI0011147391|nr:hypothetical protein [Vibrio aerogenes]